MKKCPYCGLEIQETDVMFHNCSAMREEEKKANGSIIPFLIAGAIGSLFFAVPMTFALMMNLGGLFWQVCLLQPGLGLIGGYVSYRLFKLIITPPKLAVFGFYVISAILGYIFSFLVMFFI